MRPSLARLALPALLLAASLPALGQESPPPGEQPGEAAREPVPAPAAPAPAPADRGITVLFSENRVEMPDGWTIWYYPVNFVDPKVLRTELDEWKSRDAKIEPMAGPTGQPTNLLRIRERRENLPLLEKMLEMLDQPQPQVLVRAKLVEVSYDSALEWGFEAMFDRGKGTPPADTFLRGGTGTFNPESFLNATDSRPYQGSALSFALVGDSLERYGSLDYVIRTLKSRGKAEILGEPNILATQGVEAKLNAGEEVPIQTSNFNGATLVVTTNFKKTGIELTLTPELIGRDAVRMKLQEKFSAVTGFVVGQAGVQNPIINERLASSTVTIRDGATLVVGGLQSTRSFQTEKGIPLLMDIPLVGWLFSTKSTQENKTELYFFVTPEIIRGGYAEAVIRPPGEKSRLQEVGR